MRIPRYVSIRHRISSFKILTIKSMKEILLLRSSRLSISMGRFLILLMSIIQMIRIFKEILFCMSIIQIHSLLLYIEDQSSTIMSFQSIYLILVDFLQKNTGYISKILTRDTVLLMKEYPLSLYRVSSFPPISLYKKYTNSLSRDSISIFILPDSRSRLRVTVLMKYFSLSIV